MKSIWEMEFPSKWLPAIALIMAFLLFFSGLIFSALVMPWLRGDNVAPKPVQQCREDVARIETELARIRTECIKPR